MIQEVAPKTPVRAVQNNGRNLDELRELLDASWKDYLMETNRAGHVTITLGCGTADSTIRLRPKDWLVLAGCELVRVREDSFADSWRALSEMES